MRKIVVGVDGSEASRAALRWAVEDAAAHHATVRAVHVWDCPPLGATPLASMLTDPDELESQARRELDLALDGALDAAGPAADRLDTPVERVLRCGRPAEWLLSEAKAADLLVVGERGLGGQPGMGSVSEQVVHHARCPVVVVPTGRT